MSAPPRPANVVRALTICLGLFVAALVAALFGVPMEATAPATGVVTSSGLLEVRARQTGIVDVQLRAGAELVGGHPFAVIRSDDVRWLADYWRDLLPEWNREPVQRAEPQTFTAPAHAERWLVLEIRVAPGQRILAGEVLATLVPIDPITKKPLDLMVRLDFEERHFGHVAVGQPARFASAMYNYRLFGKALGHIERLEPAGTEGTNGARQFAAVARIEEAPFELKIGSSVKAEVVTGRRKLVRVILEH